MGLSISAPVKRPAARQLVTPEGVPLGLELATLSDRISAFLIDAMFIFLSILLLIIVVGLMLRGLDSGWMVATLDAAVFALINGYFIWFELRWAGRTPGKRAVGIRVVNRTGGPLRADAIIARNLMRTVEVLLPIGVVLFSRHVVPDASNLTWVLAVLWLLGLALLPAFNRDRLRAGDLIAGTWVVRAPRASLLRDLARRASSAAPEGAAAPKPEPAPTHVFTPAELDVYGIYELQALEDVLRTQHQDSIRLRVTVAAKIAKKIGRAGGAPRDTERFLADFYAALRAHHERRLLFGKRKEKKSR